MEQMEESQRSMISQLTQLMAGGYDKEKGIVVNLGDDHEDPAYPPGFTSTNIQAQLEAYPQGAPATNRPQQYQVGTSAPMNYSTGSGSNPRDNLNNPVVPDLDEMVEIEKSKMKLPKQLEDQYRWLEEKLRAMENADYHCGVDAKDLDLIPDLVFSSKFKVLEFKKYNGTSFPKTHIMMFSRRMTRYVNNE
ncbi:uncharacterized protein LOC128039298 [Gossypium raimondii]|uniref:uncharacterized protein LOC128039298 n=1 Tax=Gossypium raimondii TaxID=29730 RepID=UPI00227BF230|nr:uncharacterized protein LOC128039298 [Gossypium raimondii]